MFFLPPDVPCRRCGQPEVSAFSSSRWITFRRFAHGSSHVAFKAKPKVGLTSSGWPPISGSGRTWIKQPRIGYDH